MSLNSKAMRLASGTQEVQKETKKVEKKKEISYFKEGQLVNRSHIVLKKTEDVQGYVM